MTTARAVPTLVARSYVLPGHIPDREAQLEVDPRLTTSGLLLGEITQSHEAIPPLDTPRPDSERGVEDASEDDREEELGEAIRGNTEGRCSQRHAEAAQHADITGVDIAETARCDRDRSEHVGDAEGDHQSVEIERHPERPHEHPEGSR